MSSLVTILSAQLADPVTDLVDTSVTVEYLVAAPPDTWIVFVIVGPETAEMYV